MTIDDSQKSPIAVFAHNRLDMFKYTIATLQNHELEKQRALYIFSDDPTKNEDKNTIEVRIRKEHFWFQKIKPSFFRRQR